MKTQWYFTCLFLPLTTLIFGCNAIDSQPVPAPKPDLIVTVAAIQTAAAAGTMGSDPDLIGQIIAIQTAAAANTMTAAPQPSPTYTSTNTLVSSPISRDGIPATPLVFSTFTPDIRPVPKDWREWQVVPELSQTAIKIIARGLISGNNPKSFSRVGDCQSEPNVFLGIYATNKWSLPNEYQSARDSIKYFQNSFRIINATVKSGYEVSSVLNPIFSNPKICQPAETPLDCELRLQHPAVVFIAMGTNSQPETSPGFEKYLRQIVDILIKKGSLPILVTKPDNVEGGGVINFAIAKVAYDYDLPMLNIWKAFEPLPKHGLQSDGIYISSKSWDTRNLYALVTLDKVRQVILSLGY